MLAREHRLALAIAIAIATCAGNAFADVAVSSPAVTCPTTTVGVQSQIAQQTITKTTGTASVTLVESNCSGGGGTFNYPKNVSLDVTIDITYTPSAAGTRTCTVTITQQNTVTFTITGTGVVPPMIDTTTPSAFPPVRVLDTAVAAHTSTRTITVTNDGGSTLSITNVTFTGDFSIDPSSANGTSTTINGGGSAKTWTLRFDPSAAGTRNGSVTFHSNAQGMPMKTVNLSGDGTTGLYTINASGGGDFGQVAAGTTAGLDIAVTHTGGAPKGILTFSTVTVTPGAGATGWFAISAQPTTLTNAQQTGTITVSCSPPTGSTDTRTAMINISADADATPSYQQMVTCTGGASQLALAISTVDMDPTLVGTTSPAKTLVLMNTGNQAADVRFGSTSVNAQRFTVSGPSDCGRGANPDCNVPAMGMTTITMTFSPLIEATVSASYNVTGAGAAPSFIVTGRGIDRHMAVPEAVQFEDTFRNSGSKATVAPVPLMNQGEYHVMISNLEIGGGDGVWTIVDEPPDRPLPTMVPGLGTADVWIKFDPFEAGKATDGQLLVANDDPKLAGGMPIIILSGNGKDRNVDMTPLNAFVGETFAGIPTRLSIKQPEGFPHLLLKNNEMADPMGRTNFTIARIEIAGTHPGMFDVVDDAGNSLEGQLLNAGEERRVDVVFNPTYPGEFDATLNVYLDEDKQPQPPVTVRGRALYIDAHGSGGCSTGHGSRGGLLLVLAVLGLVLRRRRA